MKSTNPNTCEHPYGIGFYHLGTLLNMATVNQGYYLDGERLTRKIQAHEKRSTIYLKRAHMVFVDGINRGDDWLKPEFHAQLLFNAVVNKVIGTPFALKCIDFYLTGKEDASEQEVSAFTDAKARILKHGRRLLALKSNTTSFSPESTLFDAIEDCDAFDLLEMILETPEMVSHPQVLAAMQARDSHLAQYSN